MRIDPSLMRNEAYLAPYPSLAAFLQQHPEVVQNPGYYLEHIDTSSGTRASRRKARRSASGGTFIQGFAIAGMFTLVTGALLWIIKTLVEYRRWYRTSKVQTEVHTKLLDRFTSNEDLMAYMQTPSGRRFLESAPMPIEGPHGRSARRVADPVVAAGGCRPGGRRLGLLFVSGRVIEEVAQPLFALGVLVLALGTGFVVSAARVVPPLATPGTARTAPSAPREHTGGAGASAGRPIAMAIRDVTLTDIDRLRADADDADVAFEMDEETFRAFYERTARSVWLYLSQAERRPAGGRRPAAGDLLSLPAGARELGIRVAPPRLPVPHRHQPGARPAPARRVAAQLVQLGRSRRVASPGADHGAADAAAPTSSRDGRLRPRERALLWLAYGVGSRTPKSPAPSASRPAASSRCCSAPAASWRPAARRLRHVDGGHS